MFVEHGFNLMAHCGVVIVLLLMATVGVHSVKRLSPGDNSRMTTVPRGLIVLRGVWSVLPTKR